LCGWVDMRMQVVNGQGATGDVYNNVRFIVFQWHPNTTPTAATLLLNGPSGVIDIYSMYSHDYRQQFTILCDHTFTTVGNSNAAQTPGTSVLTSGVKTFKIPLTRAQKQAQYSAGTTNGTNQLYIGVISDSALATHPSVAYSGKVVYRDS